MYREKRRNKIIIFILICILCLMGVGYAAFKTSINITGTTDISSSWDIKIISADVTDTGGAGENVKNTYNDLSASLEANLYEKGDYVEYSIIVENKGTFDAKLETIGITNSNNEAVKITSSGLTKGQTLYQNTTATLKVKIEYNSSYEGDASGTSGEAKIDLDFVQNSGGTIEPEKNHLVTYDYSTNGGSSTTAENEYINEGKNINLSYTATKEGYEFVGWNTDSNAQEGLKELTMGTSDVTLYAIFKKPDTTSPIIENVSTSSTTNSITVVVTASDEESGISKYEFKINDNEWVDNGTNNTYTFTGLTQDTGYEISVRVTNGVDLTAEEEVIESIKLTDNVVTSGSGLYKDSTEEGRYIYKGASPDNYVNFNNELWRIVSLENDGTMKIIKKQALAKHVFDAANNRSSEYCNSSANGCNVWGSNATTYDKNKNKVTAISDTYSSNSVYELPTKEASMTEYLNSEYYNNLTAIAKNKVDNHYFNVGTVIGNNEDNLQTNILNEEKYKWQGNIGLLNVTDYVKASTNTICTNVYNYSNNNSCYNNSENHNWLFDSSSNSPRFINGLGGTRANVWGINTASGAIGAATTATSSFGVRPVIYLKNSVSIISGKGTDTEPYNLGDGIKTNILSNPTFFEDNNKPKTVTITYPEGDGLIYEYQKDNGEFIKANQVQKVTFDKNGVLVARVSDGVNEMISTYVVKFASAGSDLVDQAGIVTSDDGLYKDSYEENVYTYRGSNPNNYVTFNGEEWRIISVNTSDNTIKIIRNVILGYEYYDSKYGRYRSDQSNQYCNSRIYGCKIWGSKSTLYNVNMNPITMLGWEHNGTKHTLPSEDAELNTYLNTTYYNSLSSIAQSMIKEDAVYKAGVLNGDNASAAADMNQVSAVKWKGKVALIDATEYVRASTYSSCVDVDYAVSNYKCRNSDWLYIKDISYWWTMSPASTSASYDVWTVEGWKVLGGGGGLGGNEEAASSNGVRPVVTLKPEVQITGGNGSSSNPYSLTI